MELVLNCCHLMLFTCIIWKLLIFTTWRLEVRVYLDNVQTARLEDDYLHLKMGKIVVIKC